VIAFDDPCLLYLPEAANLARNAKGAGACCVSSFLVIHYVALSAPQGTMLDDHVSS
jgi:hypothetical protein